MSRRHPDDSGFTLIELLLAMTLMLVVATATLTVFAAMERGNRDNQRFNDSQLRVRVATDTLAKRLRNLASPADAASPATAQQPIERAGAKDLVFRSVSSDSTTVSTANPQNLQRYRYCLGSNSNLYVQRQTWSGVAPSVPPSAACPGSGWPETRVVAQDVVNAARPVFHYQISPTPGTYTESTSVTAANFANTVALRTTLWVDPDTTRRPRESSLSTRVFLRNQNRPPIALLDVKAVGNKVTLNASSSDDPEGNALLYQFFDNNSPLNDPPTTSALYTYKPAAGSHSYTVKVIDVGKLSVTSAAHSVSCSSTTCTAL